MKKSLLFLLLFVASINVFAQTCDELYPNVAISLIEDCNGNCVPATWSGDNACDDDNYMYNISANTWCQILSSTDDNYCENIDDLSGYEFVNLNCEAAGFDDGDCEPVEGCTDLSACNYNSDAVIDNGSCAYDDCTCEDYNLSLGLETTEDCNGNCAPETWVGDESCDDDNYMYNILLNVYCQTFDAEADGYCENNEDLSGFNLINFVCQETSFDAGDCEEVGLNELNSKSSRKLVKIIDILGRSINESDSETIKFYIFDDGTSKKVIHLNE